MQDLTDPDKLSKALEVARRGLSDLQAYLPENANKEDGISITLKGATATDA